MNFVFFSDPTEVAVYQSYTQGQTIFDMGSYS